MAPSEDQDNRRRTFRCLMPEQQVAELVVGDRTVPVVLEDQSAGGFSVAAQRRLDVREQEIVQLRTEAGSFEARVAWISGPPPTAPVWPTKEQQPLFRLGLERVRDLTRPAEQVKPVTRWYDRLFPPWLSPLHGVPLMTGLGLLVLIAVIPIAAIVMLHRSDYRLLKQLFAKDFLAATEPAQPPVSSRAEELAEPKAPDGRPALPGAPRPLLIPDSLYGAVGRVLGGSAPAATEAIEKLRLSPGQQRQLRHLLEQIAEAFERLDTQPPPMSQEELAQIRQRLVELARRQISELLTAEQQAIWEKLCAGPPPAEADPPEPPKPETQQEPAGG